MDPQSMEGLEDVVFIHDIRPLYSCLDLEREPIHAYIIEDIQQRTNLKNGNDIVM